MTKYRLLIVAGIALLVSWTGMAQTEFDKGLSAANKKDYSAALSHFEAVLKSEPDNASAYYNMGHCYFEQKEYGEAIWAFEKALQLDPRNANTLNNLEVCHYKLELPAYTPLHSGFARSLYAFGSTNWSYGAIICFVLLALLVVFGRLTKKATVKRVSILTGLFFGIIGILIIIVAAKTAGAEETQNCAVVIDRSIPTYLNESGEKSPITLREGTRIRQLSTSRKTMLEGTLDNDQTVLLDGKGIKTF